MKSKSKGVDAVGRRSLMSGVGVAALAGVAISATAKAAQDQSDRFEPKRHALDAWMEKIPGVHRVFIDTSDAAGGSNALRYGSNILNAQINDYRGSDHDVAMIICYRHASTPFAFNDAMWKKYGSGFVKLTQQRGEDGSVPTKNILTDSIQGMVDRGVHFAICNQATMLVANMVATQADLMTDEVYEELVANVIPNSHFVPAGVMAVTRAQEYGYSLLYSAA